MVTKKEILKLFRFMKDHKYYNFVMNKMKNDNNNHFKHNNIILHIEENFKQYPYKNIYDFFNMYIMINGWTRPTEKWREIYLKHMIFCYINTNNNDDNLKQLIEKNLYNAQFIKNDKLIKQYKEKYQYE